ncbi:MULTISPECIES: NAD(P)H-binding protein [unclassified Ensifer]|uniref:NAD(P)H-binding protein n=1 Tax=unclassified Ensifer TaxID=2633371 RepID=UPI000812E098|nr:MULTISPECIES: NAD(P)H-binding protein [unclassified Ensifer]OCP09275.1 NmrA family transcriptional regulator [Ensifer sp. LC13]OCP10456.1 NmrA family transcriptional regulator [Ensifer sp. LC11]OCP13937.1 NmrA family transcriptional regulator [Ensifer sp. LC14]OCP32523.1 NmrA family transcriptional regulator [Ensifer sp. LC499]
MSQKITLVLGGTGKTGRRVAERLQERGVAVRIGARSASPSFDWEDEATWAPVLDNVDRIYVSYQPDLAVPGAVETIRRFSALAVRSGIKRLVLLSGRGEDEAQAAERELQASGAEWTIVRGSWFFENFNEGFLAEGVVSGMVYLPPDTVTEPFVSTDDIADVAVAALLNDEHVGKVYDLTGPRLMTFAQAVAEIAAASGRPIGYQSVPVADFTAQLQADGLPGDYVELIRYLFTSVLDGRNSSVTSDVERVLGRRPRDFADYARETAATGVWSIAA